MVCKNEGKLLKMQGRGRKDSFRCLFYWSQISAFKKPNAIAEPLEEGRECRCHTFLRGEECIMCHRVEGIAFFMKPPATLSISRSQQSFPPNGAGLKRKKQEEMRNIDTSWWGANTWDMVRQKSRVLKRCKHNMFCCHHSHSQVPPQHPDLLLPAHLLPPLFATVSS